jgi:hypothetical protein
MSVAARSRLRPCTQMRLLVLCEEEMERMETMTRRGVTICDRRSRDGYCMPASAFRERRKQVDVRATPAFVLHDSAVELKLRQASSVAG